MLFSSNLFLHGFLPLLLLLYFAVGPRGRNYVLLAASLLFYAWGEPALIGLMLLSTVANFLFGRRIERFRGTATARWTVLLAITLNLGLLAAFKYAAFITTAVNTALNFLGMDALPIPQITLPIGISFYTFQAMSYVIDVYRGHVVAEKSLVRVALYIALFPQLIAGPIVRYTQIASELSNRQHSLDQFVEGISRFVVGLGKKMLLANSMAAVADAVFDIPDASLSVSVAWLGLFCYTLQIYFDFSGYSDMAIGLGRMFGFHFPENFRYPYISQSVTEFWRRWHISLSTWFRDYLYIPLGGNRRGSLRTALNLLTVFLLCGLWHGASWNFVIWGAYFGLFLMCERIGLGRALECIAKPLRHFYLLLVVMIGWVFFRAETLPHALVYLKTLFGAAPLHNAEFHWRLYLDSGTALTGVLACLAATPIAPWVHTQLTRFSRPTHAEPKAARQQPASVETSLREAAVPVAATQHSLIQSGLGTLRAIYLLLVLVASSAVLAAGTHNPFIYFRF